MKPHIKYLAIYRHRNKYPIQVMCSFFEVSRSGYYSYIKKMDKPDKDEVLVQHIRNCQERCKKTYGYRRVKLWLERELDKKINHKAILRIMRKYGLLSEVRRRRKYKQMGQNLHKYSNLLNRDFNADRPNQKWVTDISYIHTGQGVLYLSMILDLFDSSVVAYKTGTEQTVNLVLNTLKAAKGKERVTTELQIHSDQGFQVRQEVA